MQAVQWAEEVVDDVVTVLLTTSQQPKKLARNLSVVLFVELGKINGINSIDLHAFALIVAIINPLTGKL